MILKDALDQIDNLGDDDVIFARRPWTLESDAEVGSLDDNVRVPKAVTDRGLQYFLEASVAQEVLEVLGDRKDKKEMCRALLVYYAEHDAYPQWVYES